LIFSRRREGELSAGQARLDRLIHKLGLQDRTRLISTFLDQTELIRLVGAADAVALPFKLVSAEAPLGVFEAMALGKPVIATRVDGLPELLAAGRGVLVPPADPAGLAEALQRLACDPDAISMMAQKARDFVSARGGWPQVARDILDVIRRSV
jgi:glycosyltransferase involved in cell wall biosynthesis